MRSSARIQPSDPNSPRGTVGLLVAVVVAAVVCCAGPVLVVAVASGTLAVWVGNPWVIAGAALLTVGAAWWWLRRRRRRACRRPGADASSGSKTRSRDPHRN